MGVDVGGSSYGGNGKVFFAPFAVALIFLRKKKELNEINEMHIAPWFQIPLLVVHKIPT